MFKGIAGNIASAIRSQGRITVADIFNIMGENRGSLSKIARDSLEGVQESGRRIPRSGGNIQDRRNDKDAVLTHGGLVNLYPSEKTGNCCPSVIFVSLEGTMAKGVGHLPFLKMLQAFERHMRKSCPDITINVCIIANSWRANEFEKYRFEIDKYKKNGVYIEAYFIDPEAYEIKINI